MKISCMCTFKVVPLVTPSTFLEQLGHVLLSPWSLDHPPGIFVCQAVKGVVIFCLVCTTLHSPLLGCLCAQHPSHFLTCLLYHLFDSVERDTARRNIVPQKAAKIQTPQPQNLVTMATLKHTVTIRQKPPHTISSSDMKKRKGLDYHVQGHEVNFYYAYLCGLGFSAQGKSLLPVLVPSIVGHLSREIGLASVLTVLNPAISSSCFLV